MKTQKGFAHLLLLLLLLVGLGVGIFLVQKTQIFKSHAGGAVIFLLEDNPGNLNTALPIRDGVYYTTKSSVIVSVRSPLGDAGNCVSAAVNNKKKVLGAGTSGPISDRTQYYKVAENPSDLASAPSRSYCSETAISRLTFKNSAPGRKYVWVEIGYASGRSDQFSQAVDVISSTNSTISQGQSSVWVFEETGNVINDKYSGLTGAVRGTKIVPGHSGTARQFNGFTDRITAVVPATSSARPFNTADFSVSLWIKPDSLNHQILSYPLAKGQPGSGISLGIVGTWDGCGGGGNKVIVYNGNNVLCSNGTVTTGSWQNLIMTYQSGTAKVYINGLEAGSGAITLQDNAAVPLTFGSRADNDWPYRGAIDDVVTWSRALTKDEVKEVYTGETVIPSPSPSFSTQPSASPSASISPIPSGYSQLIVPTEYYEKILKLLSSLGLLGRG